ncbi:MAG TPA: RiPP maturation radical SAM C-methyltransferase [Polyangia bacterium]|nr:RiPP maturation radical SAM C-methyltransferase [Polyangia bacterium]
MELVRLRRTAGPSGGHRRAGRVLLVELPFKTFSRPSLGLSLLKAALVEAGHACTIRYANLDFAALIGLDTYQTLAERVPEPLLLGDLVFAPAVDAESGRFAALREAGPLFLADGSPIGRAPDWLWERMPELQRQAAAFAARCAAEIAEGEYDIVGFSCMFQTLPSLAVARELKARAPDKWIVFGGSHCEGEMGLGLHESYPWIDFVCRGEGERLLVDLVGELTSDDAPAFGALPGLVWRDGGATRAGGETGERLDDLDRLPRPAYEDWMEQLHRATPSLQPEDLELPIESSRGCWYGQKHHCTFCGLNGSSLTFRSKSPARVLDELRDLDRYGIRFIYGVDLILDHRYFETLLPTLAREPFEHTIFFETKSNLTRAQLEALAAARITLIQPGVESLSTPVLTLMRKGVTAYQNLRLLKWAVEYGIGVFWTLLYGFPGETEEAYREMAAILPAITHLMPPQGGYKVRVDRFSPLHFDSEALGVGRTRPVDAYGMIHRVPSQMLERLAYHFEPVADDRSFAYMQPVADALRDWQSQVGKSSFVSVTRGQELHLLDRRPINAGNGERHVCLEGVERDVYLACDAGATLGAVATAAGCDQATAAAILDRFLRERTVIRVDGRYLGLAVSLDGHIPESLPASVWPSLCHAIYVQRLRTLGRFVPEELSPPKPSAAQRLVP